MGEIRQPHTPYLVFVFFYTLSIATRTTGSVSCQNNILSYPFGFSDFYPIRFNCSKNGYAEIGEFTVEEVTNAQIYVNIPGMCTRELGRIKQLFGDHFAPTKSHNTILLDNCKEPSYSCSIDSRFLNLSGCNSLVSCFDLVTTTTADVISIGEVVNRTGCKYWVSSITSESGTSGVSLSHGRFKLDWWLKDGCTMADCTINANCTQVMLPDGGLGHRCTCVDGFHGNAFTGGCSRKNALGFWIAFGSAVLNLIFVAACLLCLNCCLRKTSAFIKKKMKTSADLRHQNIKALIPLKHYSYAQVKRITKSFSQVVGKGGFGIVYRGTLSDGRSVAVKVLKDSKGNNGEEFINEVISMSKTSHVNIVDILGFCFEGSKRAILYEFLENGSLDRFISRKTSMNLDWTTLYNIALGVARGIEYLHHGCKARIIHFDIKPQNVLLDDSLCPKVSDFGLAKLCEKRESILSLLDTRGTIGFIAPEMFSRVYGGISNKSDVYSYGMLVLEMIGARNKERYDQNSASNTSSVYFPEWIYRDIEKEGCRRSMENGISSDEEEIVRKMTLVGLWCIQSWPTNRPPMNRVVEMMEGSLEALEMPPRPGLPQFPAAPFQESSSLSEDIFLPSFDET